jgi:hypothetical protein
MAPLHMCDLPVFETAALPFDTSRGPGAMPLTFLGSYAQSLPLKALDFSPKVGEHAATDVVGGGGSESFTRRLASAGVAVAMLFGLGFGGSAHAATRTRSTKNPYSEIQTAVSFLGIAYTWKTAWFAGGHCGPSIGERDKALTGQPLDKILTRVCLGPETDADKASWTPLYGQKLGTQALPGDVKALKIKLTIRYGYTGHKSTDGSLDMNVRMRKGADGWKVVGVYLPEAEGPSQYCVDSPAAHAECKIYPPGTNR